MLKTFDLRGRERPLSIYGPPGLKALLTAMRPAWGRVSFPLALEELDPHEEVGFDGYSIAPFAVDHHRITAYGYAFAEDDRPGRFDPETAERLGVAPGPDFGRLQAGETVNGVAPEQVMGEPRRGRRIVFSGDTAPCQATEVFAHQADVLVHEATFLEDELAARARPALDRPPGRRDRRRRRGAAARADPPLDALLPARCPRRGAGGVPRHARPARLRHDRGAVPRARGAAPRQGGHSGTDMSTVAFFPEGAYGPTNNCVGIGDVLRKRGHRVVFIVEESFAGALEAQGFEERLMRLAPPPEEPEVPGQFWKDFIRETAPVFRSRRSSSSASSSPRPSRRWSTAPFTSTTACARSSTSSAGRDRRGQRRRVPGAARVRAPVGADRLLQPDRGPRRRRAAAVLGLPGRRQSGWTEYWEEWARTHGEMHAAFSALCQEKARRRCPGSSSCTPRRR